MMTVFLSSSSEIIETRKMMTKVAPVYPEFIDLYEFISSFEDIKSQNELLQIFSKLIIGSNSIGVFEDKTKGVGIKFPYEESEIIYYKSQNMDYEILIFITILVSMNFY